MKNLFFNIASLLLLCLAGSFSHANEIMDAWGDDIIPGIISEGGVGKKEATLAFSRITDISPLAAGPGSWVHELNFPGDVHLRQAETYETKGNNKKALKHYRQAMAYFNAARFPATYTKERKDAYRKQLHAYRKVAAMSDFPLELVNIPFEGKTIRTHFHSRGPGPNPVLVWSGGLDGWKTGGMDFKKQLMSEGFSILAMDLPGTGESEWLLEADSERIYSAAIKHIQKRKDVQADSIAVYFGSFSGVYAIKLALTDPNITASVNHSGGIHLFFNPPIDELPPLTTTMGMRAAATIHIMGLDGQSLDIIKSHLAAFSLRTQGLLKSTPGQAPLLSIYGTADRLMPIQDLDVLMASGINSTNLVYEGDRHMAWEHADDHQPKMIDWLKVQLGLGN